MAPCLPKPRDSGKAVRRVRSSKDSVEGVFVCVGRESAMVSLWVEWEVKKHLLPSEIPETDRQGGDGAVLSWRFTGQGSQCEKDL